MHVGFSEGGKLRALDTDVSSFAMDFDAAVDAGVGENAGNLRAGWFVEGNVGDEAVAEECGDAMPSTIDKLVGDEKFAGSELFFQRADSADRDDAVDAEEF